MANLKIRIGNTLRASARGTVVGCSDVEVRGRPRSSRTNRPLVMRSCNRESKRGTMSRMKTATLPLKPSTKSSHVSLAFLLIPFALVYFALSPQACAVSPAPDGCYPNFTTAEGCDALDSLTTGSGNTGLGWRALFLGSTASFNTGVGAGALTFNNADSNTAVGAAALLLNTNGAQNIAV